MASRSKEVYTVGFRGKNVIPPRQNLFVRASNPAVAINEAKRILKKPEWDGYGRPYTITSVRHEGTLDN